MTLLELLIRELPAKGGWPEGAVEFFRHGNGFKLHGNPGSRAYFYGPDGVGVKGAPFFDLTGEGIDYNPRAPDSAFIDGDYVTVEEYKAALLVSVGDTSQQYESLARNTVWDGEGLPPVGCECEVKRAMDWMQCKILFISDHHVVLKAADEICWKTQACQFRTIRPEPERRREEALIRMMECSAVLVEATAGIIYDAIAAGKIPGVRLTDDAGS